MNGTPTQRRESEDLGIERLCTKCQDWWPEDEEFWYYQTKNGTRRVIGHCKACWSERDRSKYNTDRYKYRGAA